MPFESVLFFSGEKRHITTLRAKILDLAPAMKVVAYLFVHVEFSLPQKRSSFKMCVFLIFYSV